MEKLWGPFRVWGLTVCSLHGYTVSAWLPSGFLASFRVRRLAMTCLLEKLGLAPLDPYDPNAGESGYRKWRRPRVAVMNDSVSPYELLITRNL